MFSAITSRIKRLLERTPGVGRMIRMKRLFEHHVEQMPILQQHVLARVATLHDQVIAQPNMWAPIAEQIWEAQAAGAQILAEDVRKEMQRVRQEQVQLVESLHRRLDQLEARLKAAGAETLSEPVGESIGKASGDARRTWAEAQ